MGAYFIRRDRHGPLYRKVLERYVRLATDAGVTQAVFPEGGLSLTGALAAPRHGILRYIAEGRGPDAPDVVFVPVALNYDRVLEDRVLIGAHAAGKRRFAARFHVIAGFVMRMFWLRLRGRFRRFGRAAVSFGLPVSLSQHGGDVRALASALMAQIAREMPVLPVPLVALGLAQSGGEATHAELTERVAELITALPAHARPDLPAPRLVQAGLTELRQRHLVQDAGGRVKVTPGQGAVIAFYAASIAQLWPTMPQLQKDISAIAGL
jgi:glycerol-3-phosphate O-acyltransferase